MSTNRDVQSREKTPRRTTRRATATPVRDLSPPTRETRAGSTALHTTPATRRSTRGATRRSDQPKDALDNNVLPEVLTQQSYAYGSSKTPLLPEQLHVKDSLTMKQVANQMDNAISRAEENLDTYAADLEDSRRQQQGPGARTKRTSKEPSPPVSVTTEVQKKQRTAAWASSLDSGQLDDIAEEEQSPVDSPETRRTEPSSFPSGIFDQSYQYERGLRPPRRPPNSSKASLGSRLGSTVETVLDSLVSGVGRVRQGVIAVAHAIGNWLSRMFTSISIALSEFPESPLFSVLTKTFLAVLATAFMSYAFCFAYSKFLCDPSSTSRVAQTLESWCGSCQAVRSYSNITLDSPTDIREFTRALKQIDGQIRNIESRINSRVDSKVSALHSDIDGLRRDQFELLEKLEFVSDRVTQPSTSADVASPLIPKINYFSPANGAIVDPRITSPTRQSPVALPFRLAARILGIHKYRAHNPVTALEPWHDVGDCWCAAATVPGQDSIRLGVNIREYIYPTELVLEHPPREVTLRPDTAPKSIELWADFDHLDAQQRKDLGVDTMAHGPDGHVGPFGKTWAIIANVQYDLDARGVGHLQRFPLDINQYDDLRYTAIDYAVRVRSTYGAEYGCLYRVRLHGVPVTKGPSDSPDEAEGIE